MSASSPPSDAAFPGGGQDVRAPSEAPVSPLKPNTEWHSRGYLPHWEAGETPQSLTFRLADSLPHAMLRRWREELQQLPPESRSPGHSKAIEAALDASHGACLLGLPGVASIIENVLLHFDGERYRLHAWCIMPNHVHALATPVGGYSLSAVAHSWKSFSAKAINQVLGRAGSLWFPEYYDRKIRNEEHFEAVRHYIENNPVKARLCTTAQE
jgi:REP element-mobilizing transposase RayT